MDEHVLDASAILALLRREPGADRVWPVLPVAVISAVNVAEAASVLTKAGFAIGDARSALADLPMRIIDFDASQAFEVARLRPLTAIKGLSLADRACLALASLRGSPVLTADRAWAALDVGVEVRAIR